MGDLRYRALPLRETYIQRTLRLFNHVDKRMFQFGLPFLRCQRSTTVMSVSLSPSPSLLPDLIGMI